MKRFVAATIALLLLCWGAVELRHRAEFRPRISGELPGSRAFANQTQREIEAQIAQWPQGARRAAERMMQKYGLPDQATPRSLVWNDNGPWKRTVVHRDAGRDVLEQIAAYHVPNDRYDVIGHLQGNVSAERGRDELSSRATDEALNFLSLNLADEVISGRRNAEDAAGFYRKTAALAASGKSSRYTESLLFEPPVPGAAP